MAHCGGTILKYPEPIFSVSRHVCGSAPDCRNYRCTVENRWSKNWQLDFLETQIEAAEEQLKAILQVSVEADLLKTLPCVGKVLSMVMMLEIGRVDRFPTAANR